MGVGGRKRTRKEGKEGRLKEQGGRRKPTGEGGVRGRGREMTPGSCPTKSSGREAGRRIGGGVGGLGFEVGF